ncbi:MAG: CRISPR-associated endoribonuclease Cas6 [Candidatus Micrarchaeaceae archaeon]
MARLLIELSSKTEIEERNFNKYYMSSAIYSTAFDAGIDYIHRGNNFRYFSFSDFFPAGPLNAGEVKKVIISSPDSNLIDSLYDSLSDAGTVYLGQASLDIMGLKKFQIRELPHLMTTGSPIVLYRDNKKGLYFSLKQGDDLSFFLRRLKENSLKKYKQYTGIEDFSLEEFIFDTLKFRKEVRTRMEKMGKEFYVIGTMWYILKKTRIKAAHRDFYKFILDVGLGEKTSMGFGFLNPVSFNGS